METQAAKQPTNPLLIIAAIALILFCAAGIAAIMGWIPTSFGGGATSQSADAPAKTLSHSATQEKHHTPAAKAVPAPVPAPAPIASRAPCPECGVIESVHEVDAKGKATGVGGVGGAVVGGLLGNQIGAGRGKDVMTVAGAVGGALAGNEIEKRVKSTKSYQITVRLDDGTTRVFNESSPPAWHVGDKVRIVDGQIRSNA